MRRSSECGTTVSASRCLHTQRDRPYSLRIEPESVILRRMVMRLMRARALPLLLALCGMLAGCGASTATLAGPEESSAAPSRSSQPQGPPPDRITVDGVDLKLDSSVPFRTAQVAPDDPATVIVIGGQDAGGKPNPCTLYTVGRLLSQDDAAVRIGLYVYRTVEDLAAGSGCTAIGYPPARVRITLDRPFGSRKLICDKDGTLVPVSDPRALFRADELPAGYKQPGTLEVERREGGQVVNTMTYAGPDPDTALHLVEGPPSALEPSNNQQILQRIRVRGHDGVFQQTVNFPDVKCLRWRETDDLALAVCTRGNPEGPLSAEQLTRVAESLKIGS